MGGQKDPDDLGEDWRDRDEEWRPRSRFLEDDDLEEPSWVSKVFEPGIAKPLHRDKALASSPPGASDELLMALSDAEIALSRLEMRAQGCSDAVREGLVARLAFREAAGWLTHSDAWVHPLDLALRDSGVVGSFTAAAHSGRVDKEMPATLRSRAVTGWREDDPVSLPEDISVGLALALARNLKRLSNFVTWDPLESEARIREALVPLGLPDLLTGTFDSWKADLLSRRTKRPALLLALEAAATWRDIEAPDMGLGDVRRTDGVLRAGFIASAVLAHVGRLKLVPLPFWTVVPTRTANLWRDKPGFTADANAAVPALRQLVDGARAAMSELQRLESVSSVAGELVMGVDKRSLLPRAIDVVLRYPAVTSSSLARSLDAAPQTATSFLRFLVSRGVVRELTGRKSFRAFAT